MPLPPKAALWRRGMSYVRTLRRLGLVVAVGLIVSACDISWLFDDPFAQSDEVATPSPSATSTKQASPTATRTPTRTSSKTPTATRTPTATPTPSPTPTPTRVTGMQALLPSEADLPDGLELDQEDQDLTAAEVAVEADDPEHYAAQLAAWGYRGGASRQFLLPDPGLGDFFTEMLGFQATVLQFGSAEQARGALAFQYSYALRRDGWELADADMAPMGDSSAALNGSADYEGTTVRAAVIFVQQGNRLYRFVGISGATDHFDTTVDIARDVVGE
jgi:hypothetical protein